jgi:hypothetical protein
MKDWVKRNNPDVTWKVDPHGDSIRYEFGDTYVRFYIHDRMVYGWNKWQLPEVISALSLGLFSLLKEEHDRDNAALDCEPYYDGDE